MSDEKEFVNGLIVKAPNPAAPDFVKCSISIKRADLGNWLRSKDDEWINLQVKESKGGKWYAEVDNWSPDSSKKSKEPAQAVASAFVDDDLEDLPF